jgi:pimeloyl-ACP methyl ester carboxylesterase
MLRVRLAAAVDGDAAGLPIVLLHGFPFDGRLWEAQARALAEAGFRVIRPDLPGHGQTPAGGQQTTIDTMAQDVLRLLDRLQVSRCVLVGHSMGGYVALSAWAQDRDRFVGLALANSRAAADDAAGRAKRDDVIREVNKRGVVVLAEGMMPKLLADGVVDSPVAVAARAMIMAASAEGAAEALAAMRDRPDRQGLLGDIHVPVLVLAGSNDAIIKAEEGRQIADAVRNGTLVVIDGTGHLSCMEDPGAVNRALVTWCQALRATAL